MWLKTFGRGTIDVKLCPLAKETHSQQVRERHFNIDLAETCLEFHVLLKQAFEAHYSI
jgi:hypothetical protein